MSDPLQLVADYWEARVCGTQVAAAKAFSKAYFDEIEEHRYRLEPHIFSFAQFTRYRGKRVLEVGIGAGTDFAQWVRAGARACGVDLAVRAVEHAQQRLELEGLTAEDVRVANAEALPYPDGVFDLVYSWGVLHHTPDTRRALREIVRVLRPGGTAKIMLYHRHSLTALYEWLKLALLRGRPWKSVRWCLAHCVESPGTQAFTRQEVRAMLSGLPVERLRLASVLTAQDLLWQFHGTFRWAANALAGVLGGQRVGFHLTVEFVKRAGGRGAGAEGTP